MMNEHDFTLLRANALALLKAGVRNEINAAATPGPGLEQLRNQIRIWKAIGAQDLDLERVFRPYYLETLERAAITLGVDPIKVGKVFTGVTYKGTLANTFTAYEEAVIDLDPVVYETDQGKVLFVHGTPDGRIAVGRDEEWNPRIYDLFHLKNLVPKGSYWLVSCYNATKSHEVLDELKSQGWDFRKCGSSMSITSAPVTVDHLFIVHAIDDDEMIQMTGYPGMCWDYLGEV